MRLLATLLIALALFNCDRARAATTLLPTGEQCFQQATGPVSSGSVNMFYPGTTNPKTTWQNASQSSANANPIQLDANGCAVIYGVGSYRQQLFSGPVVGGVVSGNLIFDLTTTDTSAYNSTFWAGLSGGTPNAITVVDPGFNATDGTVINFLALATNTASTTLNPSAYGAYPILKNTTAGLVSLVGGEIVQGNAISVVFSSVNAGFILLSPPIQSPTASAAPLCGVTGYTAFNDVGTPNTKLDIAATQAVTVAGNGLNLHRSNVSVVLNFQTNGANGLDTGALAASTIYYTYLIDNGSGAASLASLSSTAPTLPTGYSYFCRTGAVSVDSSSHLYATNTVGNVTYLTVTPASTPFQLTGSTFGTCTTNFVSELISTIPNTAVLAYGVISIATGQTGYVARASGSVGVPNAGSGGITGTVLASFTSELTTAQTIYICSNSASNTFNILGWKDSTNAN